MEQAKNLKAGIKYKETPIGKIPVDWEVVSLRQITNFEYGESLPEKKRKEGNIGVFGSNGLIGYHDKFLAEGPAIIIGRKGTIGAVTWTDNNFWAIDTTYYISPKQTRVNLKWLYYLLSKIRLETLNTATGVPGLNRDAAYSKIVPSPPFNEQRKISEILTTVDEAVEKTTQTIEKAKEVKKGLMQRLLTRGINHKKFKKTEIGEIPEIWQVVKLEEVAAKKKYSFVDGPFGSNLKSIHYLDRGIPVIQSQFIISGKFNPIEGIYVSEEKAKELERSRVLAGDIVLAKIGVNFGASATIPRNYPGGILSGNTMKITPDSNKVVIEYLQHLLHYFRAIKNFDKIVSTTAQPAITLEGTRKIRIPLPPIMEQKRVAEILSSIDEEIEKEKTHKEQLELLKKGLMQVLLTGKIRVIL